MRWLSLLGLALASFLAACGGTTSDVAPGDGGGPDATSGGDASCPAVPIHCAPCCPGDPSRSPSCVDGAWRCGVCNFACAEPTDAGPDAHADGGGAPDGGVFACGTTYCDPTKQYCMVVGGGVQPADGGSNMSYTCDPLPTDCHGAGSCACVEADGGGSGCPCTEDAGSVTIECLYP